MKVINSFRGNYDFLSNFFVGASFFDFDGNKWKTSEHFYQSKKTTIYDEKCRIKYSETAGDSKRLGNMATLRNNWSDIKVDVMIDALRMKFDQNEKYKEYLVQTDGYELVEGNWWHDNFWGNCYCDKCESIKGTNMLGRCLMNLRDRYIQKEMENA